jgi:hypothetical protein
MDMKAPIVLLLSLTCSFMNLVLTAPVEEDNVNLLNATTIYVSGLIGRDSI